MNGNPPPSLRSATIRAGIGGAAWSLPFAVFSAWQCQIAARGNASLLSVILIGVAVTLVWSAIAAFVGWNRARKLPLSEKDVIIEAEVRRAAISATLFSAPVAGFFLLANWGYNPGSALLGTAMIQGMWVGSAACVGLMRGKKKARKLLAS